MASPNAAGTSGVKDSSLTALISRLEERDIPYFYKAMTKTAVTETGWGPLAYALGFPVRFVREHGLDFGSLATFQGPTEDETWPIQITTKEVHRVFAYGCGGWKAFVSDNHIEVGDTLVFSLVKFSWFRVHVIKAVPMEAQEEDGPSLDPPSKDIKEASLSCTRCKKVPPRFLLKVTARDVKQLRLPGKFCLRFCGMLPRGADWELTVPNGAVHQVKAVVISYEIGQELDVRLTSGWKSFFKKNELRFGDILEFSPAAQGFLVHVHRL